MCVRAGENAEQSEQGVELGTPPIENWESRMYTYSFVVQKKDKGVKLSEKLSVPGAKLDKCNSILDETSLETLSPTLLIPSGGRRVWLKIEQIQKARAFIGDSLHSQYQKFYSPSFSFYFKLF